MDDQELSQLAATVGKQYQAKKLKLVTAESCTGGWIAKLITDLAGSSAWFDRGYITYSNNAKLQMLQVNPETLSTHGAVSEAVVREMAEGALRESGADMAVAVSGIAGPDGGTPDKPVGTVCLAWAEQGGRTRSQQHLFTGDRDAVRRQTVEMALKGLI